LQYTHRRLQDIAKGKQVYPRLRETKAGAAVTAQEMINGILQTDYGIAIVGIWATSTVLVLLVGLLFFRDLTRLNYPNNRGTALSCIVCALLFYVLTVAVPVTAEVWLTRPNPKPPATPPWEIVPDSHCGY
jgi:hypothetical protein